MLRADLLLAVDEELRGAVQELPLLPLEGEGLDLGRSTWDASALRDTIASDAEVRVRHLWIPGLDGPEVPLIVYEPARAERPTAALLDIHGGGFVYGCAAMNDHQNRRLAGELGLVVASVDYRLAPEFPYPAGLDDCFAAVTWLQAQSVALGCPPDCLVLLGSSAGGGLAAGLALLMRDRGVPPARGQILLSPMLDDRTCLAPHGPHVGHLVWTPDHNRFGWRALLGGGAPAGADVPVYAAPAREEQLQGLPPTFVSVGALDLFLDEDVAFVRALAEAGVPAELQVYSGAYHGFARLAPDARISQRSVRDFTSALRRMLRIQSLN